MNVRVLVAGESDVANLARFPRLHNRFIGPALREYAIGIIEANDFVMLHQINMVGLQAFQTSFNLPRRNFFRAPIDFCHQKDLAAIAVLQGLSHTDFTWAFVVVPAVIHEGNAAINGNAHQADTLLLRESVLRDMEATHPDGRNRLSGAS